MQDHRQRKTSFPSRSPGHPGNQSHTNNRTGNNSQSGQADNRFGGNMERANVSYTPPSSTLDFPDDRNIGGYDPNKGKPFPVLENLGSSNLEKLMSMYDPEGLAYNYTNQLYNSAIDEGKYDPYVTQGGYTDEHGSKIPKSFVYQDAEMGEPGAVLVDGQWKKHVLNKIGGAIIDAGTTGTYDDEGRFTMDPFLGTEKGDMFTGIPTAITKKNIPGIKESLNKVLNTPSGSTGGGRGNYGNYRGYGSLGQQMYAMGLPGIMYGDMQGENQYATPRSYDWMVGVNSYLNSPGHPFNKNRGGIIDLLGDY